MSILLIVDENLEKVGVWHGLTCLYDQKQINENMMEMYRHSSKYNNINCAQFILQQKTEYREMMVIEFDNSKDGVKAEKEVYKLASWRNDTEKAQTVYNKIKRECKLNQFKINSLKHYLDIALRRVAIYDYFKTHISSKINDELAQLARNRSAYNLIHTGWAYIAAYRHDTVIEFGDRRCYWIKLIYSEEMLDLVRQNFSKDKDNKIFYGKAEEDIRYIDIFTSDEGSANLMKLIVDDQHKALNVDLKPMIRLLKRYDLFYAVPARIAYKSKFKP